MLKARLRARLGRSNMTQGYIQCAWRRGMTRSLGNELPSSLRELLDGSNLAEREGLTFLLLTNDEESWPQVAMLSVGEVVAVDSRTMRVGLWLHSGTSKNLSRSGRAT